MDRHANFHTTFHGRTAWARTCVVLLVVGALAGCHDWARFQAGDDGVLSQDASVRNDVPNDGIDAVVPGDVPMGRDVVATTDTHADTVITPPDAVSDADAECGVPGGPCCGGTLCSGRSNCGNGRCIGCGQSGSPCCTAIPVCDNGLSCITTGPPSSRGCQP